MLSDVSSVGMENVTHMQHSENKVQPLNVASMSGQRLSLGECHVFAQSMAQHIEPEFGG